MSEDGEQQPEEDNNAGEPNQEEQGEGEQQPTEEQPNDGEQIEGQAVDGVRFFFSISKYRVVHLKDKS